MLLRVPLVPHPDFPSAIDRIEVKVTRFAPHLLGLRYFVFGPLKKLVIPPAAEQPERRDELWKTTCFEAFVRGEGESYYELNFAPSGDWAAYGFTGYRQGMADAKVTNPHAVWKDGGVLAAEVELPLDGPWRLAITAVIEEKRGRKSYWSAAHGEGAPDFHADAGFVVDLPALG
ncbi:DOMON-like domain-containing protein [Sphingomonas sp. HITSZ_GF]|uniref:DOMON-like domain-containing protein n=1 Tax=Sphingomonas sp. HITSZ_GF TaxID=3037247 RepID=UPI00240D1D07|nr:DOMON-like domain-containing protein [Sphingomonas sp. HITSZ_GF]MDG2532481.1 DOMON-like domain-containing protein [Sphingomonas sp. HITSZ_GF]